MDHRSVRRYHVALPVTYFWGSGTNFFEGSGTTRDLSIRGVYILTTEVVPLGCDLFLKMSVPGIRKGSKGSEMQGSGRVVRPEVDGFAAEVALGFSTEFRSDRKDTRKKSDASGSDTEPTLVTPIIEEVSH